MHESIMSANKKSSEKYMGGEGRICIKVSFNKSSKFSIQRMEQKRYSSKQFREVNFNFMFWTICYSISLSQLEWAWRYFYYKIKISISAECVTCPLVLKSEFVQVYIYISKCNPIWRSLQDFKLPAALLIESLPYSRCWKKNRSGKVEIFHFQRRQKTGIKKPVNFLS